MTTAALKLRLARDSPYWRMALFVAAPRKVVQAAATLDRAFASISDFAIIWP